jgi:erlin
MLTFDTIEVVNRIHRDQVIDTVRKYGVDYDRIWIFDKIHHEINQFCSSHTLQEVYIDLFDSLDESLAEALQKDCDKWSTGVEVIATRVTKPHIPSAVQRNYELQEAERTKLLVSTERQKIVEMEAETVRLRAMIKAQQQADVSEIRNQQRYVEKQAYQEIQQIEGNPTVCACVRVCMCACVRVCVRVCVSVYRSHCIADLFN